jgi:hypothetical protein
VALRVHSSKVEGIYKDNLPRVAGVKVEVKKTERISQRVTGVEAEENEKMIHTRTTRFEDIYNNRSPATAPQSFVCILATHEINPQAHRYHYSFHLRVFQGYRIIGNVCVLPSYSGPRTPSGCSVLGGVQAAKDLATDIGPSWL